MKTIWKKVPSVTGGGKPHFYNAMMKNGSRVSVVWDRISKAWRVYYGPNYEMYSFAVFNNEKDCMRYAEEHEWQ